MHPDRLFFVLGASETALALFKRARSGARSADRGSLATLWLVIVGAIVLAIFLSRAVPRADLVVPGFVGTCAAGIFFAGLFLRGWAIVHLGRFFTVNVAIASDHRVVNDGPYRLVRHPSYTGSLLEFLGLAVLLTNWLAGAALFLPVLAGLLWRMRIEEQALQASLGAPYVTYMQRTKRLIPFVY